MRTVVDVMKEIESREDRMIRKTLIYKSPITQNLDYRVAYFINNYEASLWEEQITKRYKELDVEYTIYTDIKYKEIS